MGSCVQHGIIRLKIISRTECRFHITWNEKWPYRAQYWLALLLHHYWFALFALCNGKLNLSLVLKVHYLAVDVVLDWNMENKISRNILNTNFAFTIETGTFSTGNKNCKFYYLWSWCCLFIKLSTVKR